MACLPNQAGLVLKTMAAGFCMRTVALAFAVLFLSDRLECITHGASAHDHHEAAQDHRDANSSHDESHCLALMIPSQQDLVQQPQPTLLTTASPVAVPAGVCVVTLPAQFMLDHGPPVERPPTLLPAVSLSERAPPARA